MFTFQTTLKGAAVSVKIFSVNGAERDVGINGPWSDNWTAVDEEGKLVMLTEEDRDKLDKEVCDFLAETETEEEDI